MRAFDKKKGENPSANTFFSPKIQTKLQTGTPGDRYEVEADKVADKVVNKPKGGLLQSKSEEIQQKPLAENISMVQKQDMKEEETVQKKTEEKEETVQKKEEEKETVQAKCKDCEDEGKVQKKSNEEEKPVQSKSDASQPKTSTSSLETNLNRSKGSGQKMEKSTQHEMEAGFGSDFSNVTIHTDSNAVQMSEELGAHAFTHGNDVYFNNGKYNPNTKEGKHLLAHELTHTVQQGGKTQNNLQKQKAKKPKCKRKEEVGILSGEFASQLDANFYTEERCQNKLTIKYRDIRPGDKDDSPTGCNTIDVSIDNKIVKTLHPKVLAKKDEKVEISLSKLKIGKHNLKLTSPDYCMGVFKVSATLK